MSYVLHFLLCIHVSGGSPGSDITDSTAAAERVGISSAVAGCCWLSVVVPELWYSHLIERQLYDSRAGHVSFKNPMH